jgi:hypothetical protein
MTEYGKTAAGTCAHVLGARARCSVSGFESSSAGTFALVAPLSLVDASLQVCVGVLGWTRVCARLGGAACPFLCVIHPRISGAIDTVSGVVAASGAVVVFCIPLPPSLIPLPHPLPFSFSLSPFATKAITLSFHHIASFPRIVPAHSLSNLLPNPASILISSLSPHFPFQFLHTPHSQQCLAPFPEPLSSGCPCVCSPPLPFPWSLLLHSSHPPPSPHTLGIPDSLMQGARDHPRYCHPRPSTGSGSAFSINPWPSC